MDTEYHPPTNALSATDGNILSFTISGRWGHFRQIDKTTTKHTYAVIPRPTIAGTIAALLGLPRDSYYETFNEENAAIAISPETEPTTQLIPKLELSSKEGDFENKGGRKNIYQAKSTFYGDSALQTRQQRLYTYVRNPSYRIDIAIADTATYDELKHRLKNREFVYTPYLGKSECLARITYHGETSVKKAGTDSVSSIAPLDWVQAMYNVNIERTPYHLTTEGPSRKPTGFLSYAYGANDIPLDYTDEVYETDDGRAVILL